MVQLATEEDTNCYKLILVVEIPGGNGENYAARCYDSRTGVWSWMESGLVYGNYFCDGHLWVQMRDPCVFDCRTKTLYKFLDCPTLKALDPDLDKPYEWVKDRLFVLISPGIPREYEVLECEWQSSTLDLRVVNCATWNYEEYFPTGFREPFFFASEGSFLPFSYIVLDNEQHRFRLRNPSEDDWHSLSNVDDHIKFTKNELMFMSMFWCELRWDAVP